MKIFKNVVFKDFQRELCRIFASGGVTTVIRFRTFYDFKDWKDAQDWPKPDHYGYYKKPDPSRCIPEPEPVVVTPVSSNPSLTVK